MAPSSRSVVSLLKRTASLFYGWDRLTSTNHDWRLPRPPAGLPAGLREPATGLPAP